MPVPGLPPVFLTGTVTATIASGSRVGSVAIAQADLPSTIAGYSGTEYVGLQITFPADGTSLTMGSLQPNERIDVGYSLSYHSNPQQ